MEPTPQEIGLPDKFGSWRPGQWGCIENSVTCPERTDAHCVPTGGGKSPSCIASALLSFGPDCKRVAIITANKGLQDQYMHDFADNVVVKDHEGKITGYEPREGNYLPIVNVSGKSNYRCTGRPGWTCEEGHNGRCPNAGTVNCAYSAQYFKAITAPIVLTNYSYWISVHKYGHGLGQIDHLFLDEFHLAFKELSNAVEIQLGSHEIEEMLGQKFPKQKDSLDVWKSWAAATRPVATEALKDMLAQIAGAYDVKASWVKDFHHLKNLARKLGTLATVRVQDWVTDDWEHGFQFDAIRPSRYAERLLYLKIPRRTLYSATMTGKTLGMCGIYDDYSFWEYDSVFSLEGDPVMHVPTVRVNNNMSTTDLQLWLMQADRIIGARGDRRGIFHTVSHERRKYAFHRSDFARWMITNAEGDVTADVVERYKRTPPPAVLLSPSVGTGYDFIYDEARYQIIGKVPWPNIGGKLYQARVEFDPTYGAHIAAAGLEQMCGRVRRAEDDWGESIVLDDGVLRFVVRYCSMLSKNFHRRFKPVQTLPAPPLLRRAA